MLHLTAIDLDKALDRGSRDERLTTAFVVIVKGCTCEEPTKSFAASKHDLLLPWWDPRPRAVRDASRDGCLYAACCFHAVNMTTLLVRHSAAVLWPAQNAAAKLCCRCAENERKLVVEKSTTDEGYFSGKPNIHVLTLDLPISNGRKQQQPRFTLAIKEGSCRT